MIPVSLKFYLLNQTRLAAGSCDVEAIVYKLNCTESTTSLRE